MYFFQIDLITFLGSNIERKHIQNIVIFKSYTKQLHSSNILSSRFFGEAIFSNLKNVCDHKEKC